MATYNVKLDCGHTIEVYTGMVSAPHRVRQMIEDAKAKPCKVCGSTSVRVAKNDTVTPAFVGGSTEHTAVAPTSKRTNRRTQACDRCGRMVRPGEGHLFYGGDEYESHTPGWRVVCLDQEACEKYRTNPARIY